MPKIEKIKEYKPEQPKEQDVVMKVGRFRFYFQNYYTIISLTNDLLTGLLYFIGSLSSLLGADPMIGQIMYILGGFFLLMRPIIRIIRNVFIYNKEQFEEVVADVQDNVDEDDEKELETQHQEESVDENKEPSGKDE